MPPDHIHLRRAIRLAMNGRGLVEPNPMVGCVIVKNNRVIGEGFHQKYGQAHAEPNALASCTESPEGATAYVTLEPCCHTNKQTPPCVPRLIAAKISRVVIGCLDPNPDVNGNGVQQLRAAGITVDGPLLENECKQLIAPFFAQHHWFYMTLKWAESADGKVAGPNGQRVQISNPASSQIVQLLRSRSDAIAVGINTVLKDDPILLPRGVPMLRPYVRMVLDTHLRTPLNCRLVQTAHRDQAPVDIYTLWNADETRTEHLKKLTELGVQVIHDVDADQTGRLDIEEWFGFIYSLYSNILVEPGPTLAASLLPWSHRLWVIRSPKIIGDHTAPSAAAIPDHYVKTGERNLDGDVLSEYLNTKPSQFYAAVESADLVLIP